MIVPHNYQILPHLFVPKSGYGSYLKKMGWRMAFTFTLLYIIIKRVLYMQDVISRIYDIMCVGNKKEFYYCGMFE